MLRKAFIQLQFVVIVFGASCKVSLECNKPDNFIKCSYCKRNSDKASGECAFIDKEIFSKIGPCEYSKSHCGGDYCKHSDRHYEGYGECVCFCRGSVYDKQCSHQVQGSHWYPGGFQFFPPLHMQFHTPTPLLISVGQGPRDKAQLQKMSFVVQDLHGGYVARLNVPVETSDAGKYCEKLFTNATKFADVGACRYVRDIPVQYLYEAKVSIPFDWSTPYEDKPTSFVRQLQLETYWGETKLTTHVHSYHLDAPLPSNPPAYNQIVFKFTNCGPTVETAHVFLYKESVVIKFGKYFSAGDDKYVYNYDKAYFKWLWQAYKLEGDTYRDQMKLVAQSPKMAFDWKAADAFTWQGIYVVNISIQTTFVYRYKTDPKGKSPFSVPAVINYICLVRVDYSPLEAAIAGGSSRFVYRELTLLLDGSKSKNPNTPDGTSKMMLMFSCNWTAEEVCKPHSVSSEQDMKYKIKPRMLQANKTYRFTLTVYTNDFPGLQPAYARQNIVVGALGGNQTAIGSVTIECVYNCATQTNPKDITYLRVGGEWALLTLLKFKWEITHVDVEGGLLSKESLDALTQTDTPSFILIVNEKILKEDAYYELKVTLNGTAQFASYSMFTSASASLSCQVEPQSGEPGVTVFSVSCTVNGTIDACEFYDKYDSDEAGFSGRMIATEGSCNLNELVLTRGMVVVNAIDEYGTETSTSVKVQLSKGNNTKVATNQFLEVDDMLRSGEELLKRLSVFSDMLISKNVTAENHILEKLLKSLSFLSRYDYEDAKLCLSVMHLALQSANGFLSVDATLHTSVILHTVLDKLSSDIRKDHLCTYDVFYQIIDRALDCFYSVLTIKDKHTPKDTPLHQYMEPALYAKLNKISQNLMGSLVQIQRALLYRQLPAQKGKLIESRLGNLSAWAKADLPSALSKYTQDQNRKTMFPVYSSAELAADVKRMGNYLSLNYINMKLSPVIAIKTNTENLIDATIGFKGVDAKKCFHPKFLKHGVYLQFEITNLISKVRMKNMNISTKFVSRYLKDPLRLELNLPVYKIDPALSSLVVAQFHFEGNSTELLVMVSKDMRPTYETLITSGTAVNAANTVFQVITNPQHSQYLYYLAIYPNPQVYGGSDSTVKFEMKIYSKGCYNWHKQWATKGCFARTDPRTGTLICECKRLSLIGGLVQAEKFPLDVVSYFPLHMTCSVSGLWRYWPLVLLALLLIALMCRRGDRRDVQKRYVSVVPDNMPRDRYGYLVCVVTGSRLGSGTDAAVGMQISGSKETGRIHYLTSDMHPVMQGMGEDWFMLYEPEHLGTVEQLDIWHDNTGPLPDWYCDSIVIYDIRRKNCYFFLVRSWVTLSLKRFPQIGLFPTPFAHIASPSRVFFEYVRSGFQLSHLWLSIWIRHPRDPVSRVDRFAIILCFISTSMLVSIILMNTGITNCGLDDYRYSITWLMIEFSIYAFIVAAIVAHWLMYMFKRMYKIIYYMPKASRSSLEQSLTEMSFQEDYLAVPLSQFYTTDTAHLHFGRRRQESPDDPPKRTLAETINLTLMPRNLVPVQLPGDARNVIINRKWLYASWTVVFVMIIVFSVASTVLSANLPPVRTQKWFTIVFFSVIIHAFIFRPLKIISVAALLAVAFKRIIYKDVYTFNPEDGQRSELFGNFQYLSSLIRLKSHPVYKPYSEVFREEHRQKMLRARRWHRLYLFFVELVFLFVIGTIIKSRMTNIYETNNHLHIMMNDFHKVFNNTDIYKYLENKCLSRLFSYIWYNWEVLNSGLELNFIRKDWMSDSVSRMMGKVTLAQFRVKPGYCTTSVNLSIDCAAPFTKSAEDTDTYFPYWLSEKQIDSEKHNEDLYLDLGFLQRWSYWHRNGSDIVYEGVTGNSYFVGGYSQDLMPNSDDFEVKVETLSEEHWIDHYTRAVLVKIHVYNVNTRIFSEMVLIAEQTVSGWVLPAVVVNSVDKTFYMDWWRTLFVVLTCSLCVRIFLLANFAGVFRPFSRWTNACDVLIAVSAILVFYNLLLHSRTAHNYMSGYRLETDDIHNFSFYQIAHYMYKAHTFLLLLYVFIQVRFFTLCRFGRTVFSFVLTATLSTHHIVFLIVIYLTAQFLLFRATGYNVLMCKDVGFNPNMYFTFTSYCPNFELTSYKILCNFVYFSNVFIIILFVCIFTHAFKTAKAKCNGLKIDNCFTFVPKDLKNLGRAPMIEKIRRRTLTS